VKVISILCYFCIQGTWL